MDELQKLYDVLVREGKYTKSFDEFKNKWSSNTDYQDQVFDVVSRDGLYTKDKQSFFQKYSGAAPVFEQQVTTQPQVKKKEPTPSVSGATPSVSQKPVSQFGQQLTQIQQEEPTTIPAVLTEEGKATYVPPTPKKIKPFDIKLATETLKKINQDKIDQAYKEDPTLVVKKEKERAIQEANDGILTNQESLSNIASNAVTTIKMAIPKMNLVADQALEKLFGRELASKLVGKNIYTGATMDEERTKALREIGDLMSQMKETTGITESVKKLSRGEDGSASDLIVAAANSLAQIGTTAIEAIGTGGISLFTDAVGGALYDYNEEKAKQKGKTIEQLFQDGEADTAVPTLFGGVSFYLDKIGLQGATNMIKKKLTGDFMKKATLFGFETNKEGMTEWFQEGVDASNAALGKGGSAKDATQAAVDAMFSERGLETYLQGSVGSAALAGGARLISKDNHNDYSKLTEENVKLLGDLKNGNIDTDTKKMVLDVLADNKSKLDDILSFDRKVIDKLPEEDKAKVADLYVELNAKRKLKNNGNISEVLRTKVIEDVDKLETEISNIVNKVAPKEEVSAPVVKPALTLVETIRRDELQTAIDEQKNTTGIIVIGDESLTKEEAVNELQLLNKKEQDAIQKQTTDEGVLRTEQPEVGLQEVGEGDQVTEVVTEEGKPKEEVVTTTVTEEKPLVVDEKATNDLVDEYISKLDEVKEKSPETFWSVDKPFQDESGDIDREKLLDIAKKGKLIKTDAGFGIVGDDGDIKGVFKYDLKSNEKTGDVVVQEAIKQGGIKLDNFALPNLMKVYERNGFKVVSTLPFNEEYAPVGWDKEKNGTPNVVAMVYDPNNQLSVEPKDFTDYDEAIAYRDSYADKIKAPELDVKVTTEQVKLTDEAAEFEKLLRKNRLSNPYERANKSTAAQIENHRRLAMLARRALAKVAPDVKIILHETPEAYDAAVPKPSQGYFDFANNTIHINLQYAGIETVPHEVFHAILAIKIKTDPRATQVTKEMMQSVMKVLDKDSPVYKQIEKLSRTYEDTLKDEEKLAELFGILSINYEKLPVPAKNAIVRFIEKIAKLFGLDAGKLIGRTDNSVINLLNTLSEKVAKGEEIKESEISMLGKGGDGTRTSMFKDKADNINEIVKLGRANGVSEETIASVLKNRGFSDEEIINTLATELGAKKTVDITEEMLPGMESLMSKVNAMIKRQKSKGVDANKIAENVQNLVQKSDVYINATDVQKESLVREARKTAGVKEKSAPSVARVKEGVATETESTEDGFKKFFGQVRPEKKITATEKSLLAKQIRDTANGAKNAKKAFMQINNELTKYIKKLAGSGTITVKQAAAALRKLSGVNVFDQVSIDRFVDYMSNTFNDAEYAEKVSEAMAKLPNARKNARTKIGIADSLTPALTRMLGINPSLIPTNVFDSYLDIVRMIGERSEVLNLEEVNSLTNKVNDILNAVNAEVALVDDLAERFDSYDGKIFDEDGKLNYAETIRAMLNEELISDNEAELMKKYKSSILPAVESVKMTDEELAQEKKDLIEAIEMSKIEANDLPTREERDLANELSELIETNALDKLTNTQLKNLFKTIDNINNGYLTHYAQLMVERMNAINKSVALVNGIKKASLLPISKLYSNLKSLVTKKNAVSELIRRIPLINIDQQLGNYKDKTVFNAVFEKAAEAESAYKSSISKIQHRLSDAQEAVAKSFKNDGNKTLMSSFKTMTYMIQLEHDSNIESKQVNQASDYLKATIKHIDEGKSQFGEVDANMLQDILDKYTNDEGQIDADKLYKSFNSAEKEAIKTIRDINESLTDKAVYTASIIRGDKISPLNNYVHLNVLRENLPTDNIAGVSSMEQYNNSLKPSTKAKSLIERTGKVSPINFDVFASASRGANFVLMDYYLTEPIRTARKTFNEATASLESEGRIPKEQREILNAVNNAFEEVVSNILANNFVETSFMEDAVTAMTKQGYRAILASTTRFVSELSSNIAYAMNDPKALSTGVKLMPVIMGPDAVEIMNNLKSKQTTRVFHGDTLSGRLVDTSTMNQVSGIKGGKGKGVVVNKLQQIYNNTLKKEKNFVELTADTLISTPDKMVMRPIWFGSFANEFERITGTEPDLEKISQNDEAYMRENKDALDKARDVADNDSVMAGSTENSFMGILKGTVKPNQSGWIRGFNTFNNFMTKFMIFEYVTARTAVNAAIGNGSISKSRGVALLAGVTSRMIIYTLLSQYLGNGLVGLFSDDDEPEDDKSFFQKLGQSIASAATGLILGRDYGNAAKNVINFGVEKMNEEYLDFLRNGDYDPYEDAIQYSVIPNDPNKSKFDAGDFVMKIGGPLGPAMKTAALTANNLLGKPKQEEEAIKRQENELGTRIPLEILGNAGFIPLYKDVRKVVLADIYKDLNKAKKSVSKKDIEEANLQGYESKSDMERYNPELYEATYGKGSPTYEVDKIIKDIEKQQKDIEQKIKDAAYGYTEKNKTKKKK